MGDAPSCESEKSVRTNEKTNECVDNKRSVKIGGVVKALTSSEKVPSSKIDERGEKWSEIGLTKSSGRRVSSGVEKKSVSRKTTERVEKTKVSASPRSKSNVPEKQSNLPILKSKKSGSTSSLAEKKGSPARLAKSESIASLGKESRGSQIPAKTAKVPPKVPAKPKIPKESPEIGKKSVEIGKESVAIGEESVAIGVSGSGGTSSQLRDGKTETKTSKEPELRRKIGNEGVPRPRNAAKDAKDYIADFNSKILKFSRPVSDSAIQSAKGQEPGHKNRLQRSQSKVEKLQRDLKTKIEASNFKGELAGSRASGLRFPAVFGGGKLDLNENVTRAKSDKEFAEKEFLEKHNLDKKLTIEEKRVLETDLDYVSDSEKSESLFGSLKSADREADRRQYRRSVSEIEKRWSGEFLEGQYDRHSSESSKSSYVEELGSASSHEGLVVDANAKFIEEINRRSVRLTRKSSRKNSAEDLLEDTVSTVDSNSCVEEKLKDAEGLISSRSAPNDDSNESKASTLKKSSVSTIKSIDSSGTSKASENLAPRSSQQELEASNNLKNSADTDRTPIDVVNNNVASANGVGISSRKELTSTGPNTTTRRSLESSQQNSHSDKDGYADLIKTFAMEAGTSRAPKEEKKRKGFRRLLPASLFSPKDSRKDYKKDQKERKKRDEKHFSQYQQNGNYTRSPDTMNLNEDIKRNVKLNTSLNSSIIEERLNEIKQELFPEQVLTTSTPDHFLHTERDVRPNSRDQRFYTTNSSLSSIAPEDKWIDQNIISGSPDMRKLKQRKGETDRICALERKHSLQEAPATDGRFIRNHGPSGRISAPPGERFLIRPRAVHPVDRPLPAIPQRVELYADYDNHHPTQRGPQKLTQEPVEFPEEVYTRDIQDYQNANQLYEERNNFDKTEANRNHSIDSGFNLTPVSAQVKITRQPVINQNQKAPLIGRSPKYSPSSSQKSGDYADSSYTPNSSQKSEFSPTSSKSGEYYLNSSRTSDHTSPNDSLNEKREQIYENNSQQPKIPYPISPNVKIQNRPLPVYDLTPPFKDSHTNLERARSPLPYQDSLPEPRTPKQSQDEPPIVYPPRNTQEPVYAQQTSPQIPLSASLAKTRAHAENDPPPPHPETSPINQLEDRANTPPRMYRDADPSTESDRRKAYEMRVDSPTQYVVSSPSGRPLHPTQSSQSSNSPRLKSPTRSPVSTFVTAQRVTSPLTVLPLDHPKSTSAAQSPHSQQNTSVSPLPTSMSPRSRTPTISPRTNDSRQRAPTSGSSMPMSLRRSQPNEQILIASPKRDAYYESQIYSRGSSSRVPGYPVSPVPMTDSPNATVDASDVSVISNDSLYEGRQSHRGAPIRRTLSPHGTQRESPREHQQPRNAGNTVEIQRPEPIYGQRIASPNQEAMYTQRALSPTRGQDAYSSGNENRGVRSTSTSPGVRGSTSPQPPIYPSEQRRVSPVQQPLAPGQQQSMMYTGRPEPLTKCESQQSIYGTRLSLNSDSSHVQGPSRQASPTKRQTMQHLEAYYWQQKALEAQKKTTPAAPAVRRQTDPRVDHPEIREAMYWHQLKKMEEEQQKKIYQQNVRDERTDPLYWRKKLQSPPTSPTSQEPTPKARSSEHPGENIYWRSKLQQPKSPVVSKPPIMSQKGQNQPVLVVRPQPVYQAKEYESRELYSGTRDPKQEPPPRSKSASPLFARSDERRSLSLPRKTDPDDGGFLRGARERSSIAALRKVETPSVYEEDMEADKKPPPIFKRGSLLSNSSNSVDYGTGQKRVSFSNQTANPEVGTGAGIWPTKHGMAPEPPTRQHRAERSAATSDSDSVFLHEAENENNANTNLYGNLPPRSGPQTLVGSVPRSPSRQNAAEYDANRPLPPPPRDMLRFIRRSSSVKDQTRNNQTTKADPIIDGRRVAPTNNRRWPAVSESESGSEAGEIQRILRRRNEEEWNPDSKGRTSNDTGGSGRGEGEGGTGDLPGAGRRIGVGGPAVRGSGGSGGRSRDEPRRHTLSGDHQPSLHHQQFNSQLHPLHPHHLPPPHGQYGSAQNRHATTMDLEMGTKSRQRKSPLPRGYPPPSTAMLFDDDPGIMSEVETSSTGFRRGGKQRSSLPVVRTASKTLERPLGLVFLQYRNETKRALLPNEITSIDTVKALFVRSFPKQLTMEYLDSPLVKVYIHDSNKDMFYELEDMRSHLRDIRDRSVLRLFESSDGVAGMPGPLGAPGGGGGLPPHWEDQSYFSEPEFDSEYQHQHIHKSKTAKNSTSGSGGYYMGSSSTLPRGGPLLRAYSPAASSAVAGPNASSTQAKSLGTPGGGGGVPPAKPLRSYQCGKSPLGNLGGSARFSRDSSVSLYSIPDRLHGENGYMSSPERSGGVGAGSGRYPGGPYSTGSSYEDPYYSQYSGTVTPVIDEEASDTELLEESYSLYGVKPPGRPPTGPPRSPFPPGAPALTPGGQPYDATRIRVEHMERQLANLTGLVQKALTHAPHATPSARDYLQVPAARDPYRTTGAGDEFDKHSSSSSTSLPDKSVSFEKSVSFSDEPPDMNSPKQHSPQHAERDRHKPTPPPKPATLAAGQYMYRDLALTPEMYNQLRCLQKKAKDLRQEVRNIMRMSQTQALAVRETIRDTSITIRAVLLSGGDAAWANGDTEKVRLSRDEDLYKQGMLRLEKDLTELESSIEELRGNVINRKTRVNMSDVENMALILSKSSKTVADLKVRFPSLQEGMKGLLSAEMEKVIREEKFLKEEPERLESALHRCKKLTGTLVTLKRLASVQEQRLPNAASVEAEETPPITPTSAQHSKATAPVPAERTVVGSANVVGGGSHAHESSGAHQQRPENALDALLDELQTFSRPGSQLSQTSSIGYPPSLGEVGRSAGQASHQIHPGGITEMSRKGSIDSSTSFSSAAPGHTSTLRRLHSYPSSSDTDTSPPIARLQVSDGAATPSQKPPVPERNAELLQLATARRVPPPPPPRTSSRSPLASPTSPQLPPRNPTTATATGTLRRGRSNPKDSGKPPMALPSGVVTAEELQQPQQVPPNNMLSASNSSSCESINSQEGLQNKKGRQEQLEQRHQELLRKQKALQEQYARLQQLQRNASGLTTVPPTPPDLLKKTGSESNLLAKMGLGLSTASSGSLTSLAARTDLTTTTANNAQPNQSTTSKIYETDIL